MKYFIVRTIGNCSDTLACLWEGNDLPTFRRDGNPYLFDDYYTAQRVLWRLEAKYPKTFDTSLYLQRPIQYRIEKINTTVEVEHQPEQQLAMLV